MSYINDAKFDKSFYELLPPGSYLTLSEEVVSKSTRRGEVCITIRNLKEEAKDDNVESGISDDD